MNKIYLELKIKQKKTIIILIIGNTVQIYIYLNKEEILFIYVVDSNFKVIQRKFNDR
jgi:cell division protein FtsX